MFKTSLESLRQVKTIAGVSLFCALYLVLSAFTINITPELRITFGFLAVAASCWFYGPVPNLLAAVVTDFLGWAINPTGPYFPGFLVNALVQALVYSLFFYGRKDAGWKQVLPARLIVVLVNNLLLNPLWLSMLYGDAFLVLLSARIVKNILLFPIDCILLVLVLKVCERIKR